MRATTFSSSYSSPPGEYEESEQDHLKKKRPVAPVRVRGNPEGTRAFYHSQRQRHPKSKLYITDEHIRLVEALLALAVQVEGK